MNNVEITAVSKAIPKKVITNDDLSEIMDTSDEWIKKRTGIRKRHFSSGENTSDLASEVAKKLLKQVSWTAADLDLIVVATMSPDSFTPSVACLVQGKIDADKAVAFDISAACSGFSYALEIVRSMIAVGDFNKALVIGAEVLSKLLDFNDRTTAVLFGDGAAGVILEKSSTEHFLAADLKSYGNLAKNIVAGKTEVKSDFRENELKISSFQMNGREVYRFATHEVPNSIIAACSKAGLSLDQIDCFILHQANSRIIKQVAKRLGQDEQKFPINIDEYGNTSAASEAILLAECVEKGIINKGDLLVLSGFGGGLTTATVIFKY